MNIAIFTPSQNPYSETFIQAHKNYLKGRVFYYYGEGQGIQLEGQGALCSVSKHRLLTLQAKVLKWPKNKVRDAKVLSSLKDNKIDVILVEYGTHAHNIQSVLKASGLPVIVHFHGYDASKYKAIARCKQYKEVFEMATTIICVSTKMQEMLLELGCPKDKLVYNVYGPQKEFEAIQPKFSKQQFVAIGRFTDKKAPYYTIMAFKKAADNFPDARLLMAGNGALLNTCKNLVKQFNLEQKVVFLGIIKPEEYRKLLTESLAFVQHSITAADGDMEGTPLAVLEASVAGVPVIATNHAGIPDVIKHGKTGLLCNEHQVAIMAQHMEQVLANTNLAKQLGAEGKQHILNHYTVQRHIQALDALMLQALNNSK